MRMSGLELLIILAIVLLVFGPKQLPKLTNAVNDSMKKLKKANKEGKTDEEDENSNITE